MPSCKMNISMQGAQMAGGQAKRSVLWMRAPGMVGGLPGRLTLLPGIGEPAPLPLHVPSQPGLQVLLDLHTLNPKQYRGT